MLTFQQARQIAENKIKEKYILGDAGGLAILDGETIEKPYAWIFFYNSNRFIETDDDTYALGGNAPLFISKADGQIRTFRTGLSVDEMIEEYEEERCIWSLQLIENVYADSKKLQDLKNVLSLSMGDIINYKNSANLVLTTGSERRLSNLQKLLNSRDIQTELVPRI
jgi:hypothetical protein